MGVYLSVYTSIHKSTMFTKKNALILLCLSCITLFGAYLRFINISPYKFYPDSYQNLLVAKNIMDYGNVSGTLGIGGIQYPPYITWTRPIYALSILLSHMAIGDFTQSAQYASFIFGVLAIPISFFLIKRIFNSNAPPLFAAFLLSISFNHTVWSGFIMSETTGVFFSLLYFILLFSLLDRDSKFLSLYEITAGVIFAFSVFARFEYVVLIIPSVFLLLLQKSATAKIVNIVCGFLLTSSFIYWYLFPPLLDISGAITYLWQLMAGVAACIIVAFLIFIVWKKSKKTILTLLLLISHTCILLGVYFFLNIFLKIPIPWTIGFSHFANTEILLIPNFFIGAGLLLRDKRQSNLGIFCLTTFVLLEFIYYRTNPLQQRYSTHLMPIFLIGASYAFLSSWSKAIGSRNFIYSGILSVALALSRMTRRDLHTRSVILLFFVVVLIALQIRMTFYGFKKWSNGDWNKPSYEEEAAVRLNEFLDNGDVLIAAMPEAYYYFTGHTIQGVSSQPPFYHAENLADDTNLIIVNDMAMRDIHPDFSAFLESQLQDYKFAEFDVAGRYQYLTHTLDNSAIVLYKISQGKLHEELK